MAGLLLTCICCILGVNASAGEVALPASEMRLQTTGKPVEDGAWHLDSRGAVGDWFKPAGQGPVNVTIRAAGRPARGVFPIALVQMLTVDGGEKDIKRVSVDSEEFRDYKVEVDAGGNPFRLSFMFTNDFFDPPEDRNLIVEGFRVIGAEVARRVPSIMDQVRERIKKYRTGEMSIVVRDPEGKLVRNEPVTVRMTRHKFLFGCNIYRFGKCRTPRDERLYRRYFSELFNFATLPFYWASYEPEEGRPSEESRIEAAKWCAEHAIRTKGHPLFWTIEPRWVGRKSFKEGEAAQMRRITREMKNFSSYIETWDVLNEAVVGPVQARSRKATNALRMYNRYGRVGVIEKVFAVARKANPRATLILNDYRADQAFEDILKKCFDKNIDIDVIGIQSHMHGGCWGAWKAWSVCSRFAQFDKPLHFTETTIVSGPKTKQGWNTTKTGEEKQAKQAAQFYTLLFSHPAVEAITWWDFSDQGAWQGAPAGFLRKDMSPKPVYRALKKLIKEEWWTQPQKLRTDSRGRVTFRGFLGDYTVETNDANARIFMGKKGKSKQDVHLDEGKR